MCSVCNEFLIESLEEGNLVERSGKEVKDNCEVHQELTHATYCFPQV